MEDDYEYSQWESLNALEILESDIADVDTTNVKLVRITSHPFHEMYINYSLLTNTFPCIASSFCRFRG